MDTCHSAELTLQSGTVSVWGDYPICQQERLISLLSWASKFQISMSTYPQVECCCSSWDITHIIQSKLWDQLLGTSCSRWVDHLRLKPKTTSLQAFLSSLTHQGLNCLPVLVQQGQRSMSVYMWKQPLRNGFPNGLSLQIQVSGTSNQPLPPPWKEILPTHHTARATYILH